LGVPLPGFWAETLNTDAAVYGGANRGNMGGVAATETGHNGQPHSIDITLPGLATLVFTLGKP
jgi:1,4-alpha-glucan branching enzyme